MLLRGLFWKSLQNNISEYPASNMFASAVSGDCSQFYLQINKPTTRTVQFVEDTGSAQNFQFGCYNTRFRREDIWM